MSVAYRKAGVVMPLSPKSGSDPSSGTASFVAAARRVSIGVSARDAKTHEATQLAFD